MMCLLHDFLIWAHRTRKAFQPAFSKAVGARCYAVSTIAAPDVSKGGGASVSIRAGDKPYRTHKVKK
jgi:hypothetical protein